MKRIKKYSKSRYGLVLMVGVFLVIFTPISSQADVVDFTGRVDVPGMAGQQVRYRLGAIKTGAQTSSFWLQVKNPSATTTINFVVCFMHNLKTGNVPLQAWAIRKNADSQWACTRTAGSDSTGPPNAHLSCQRVSLGPGAVKSFDYTINWMQNIRNEDLATVYIDFLKDCPVINCEGVFGGNKFLYPSAPEGHRDWVNAWAGQGKRVNLTPSGRSREEWPSSNWVTMGDRLQRRYPAHMLATLQGAPANAVIQLSFNGVPGRTYSVQPDRKRPPCGGLPVSIDEHFVIPPGMTAEDGYTLDMPSGPCGMLAEGTVIRFIGQVLADPGAPVYSPGDLMYVVHSNLVKDTEPPVFLEGPNASQVSDTSARFDVTIDDLTTIGAGATLYYTINKGPLVEAPMDFSSPSQDGPEMSFSRTIGGLRLGDVLEYYVTIYDELGNAQDSDIQTLEILGSTAWTAIAPGETLADFETPVCPRALTTISGNLPGDKAHLYCVNVTASQFLATTTGTDGTLDDTMLALFDADGMGVYFDDDNPAGGTLRSILPNGHPAGPQADGIYFLAISGFARHPISGAGLIWSPTPYDVVRAPDGPGAAAPLVGFQGIHAGGTYTIALRGVTCCVTE